MRGGKERYSHGVLNEVAKKFASQPLTTNTSLVSAEE